MNHLTSTLTLHQPTEETVAWATQRLLACGFQVERTFDLHAARMSQVDCPCPYHGTNDCTCQMIVLLVRGQRTQPVTLVVHGHDGQTCLSMVDIENSAMNEDVIRALIPVMENSDVWSQEDKDNWRPWCGLGERRAENRKVTWKKYTNQKKFNQKDLPRSL